MNKLEKFVSWLALIVSLTTIGLHIFKVLPFSVVDSNTFVSTIVAIIGILVTILVGYQIYEAVEIKQKLKEMEVLQRTMKETREDLEKEKIKMQEQRCMLMYHVFYNGNDREVDAFLRLHEALQYILSTDEIHGDMKYYFDDLKNAMCWIDAETIGKCVFQGNLSDKIEDFKYLYKNCSAYIKKHENYFIIQETYEAMMSKFDKRIEDIKSGKHVSPREIDGVIQEYDME